MDLRRFTRTEQMIGAAGLQRLQQSFVTVIGLGAVGSYATEALVRSGVGRLRLVDFDTVHTSNLNRQLYALESTLGQPKVQVARQRVLDINPACQVECLQCFAHAETMDAILAGPPHLLVDAIDSLTPKVEVIAAVLRHGIPLVSSMGAALRTDPSLVRSGPLGEVSMCRLARALRNQLRRRKIPLDFLCVYSLEQVDNSVLRDVDPDRAAGEPGLVRGRTRRVLASLPTLTGIFGLTVANTALKMLLGGRLKA